MHPLPEPAPAGPPPVPTVPVICDLCRAKGNAGDPAFAAIPNLLDFAPVPRRAHANNWTAEHQRAFIAALAITGSPRQAARALGRHAFGADQLRRAKGGREFSDAWDAALELARDRELARIRSGLEALAADQAAKDATPFDPANPRARLAAIGSDDDDDDETAREREYEAAGERIRKRLLNARRLFIQEICEDEYKRVAFEILTGQRPDWERAAKLQPQDDEPYKIVNFRKPDMLMTTESGWVPEFTGNNPDIPDKVAALRQMLAKHSEQSRGESTDG